MKKYISELLGTFVLVLIGCGTAIATLGNVVATSLAFGLVIVAMAYSIGSVSGCHINPAVSLSMFLTKKMNVKDFIFYILFQIIGAILAALVLGFLFGSFKSLGANTFGVNMLSKDALNAFVVELILTFIFILVILSVTSKKENSNIAGLIIGLTLVLVHLIGIGFTGTSVNPARSIGPAIFEGKEALCNLWVFIISPLCGAALASLFYKFIIDTKTK